MAKRQIAEGNVVLAVGAHLKNTIGLSVGPQVFLSQHIGDLETDQAFEAFRRVIADFETLYEARPSIIAADAHPDYLSTKFARDLAKVGRAVPSGAVVWVGRPRRDRQVRSASGPYPAARWRQHALPLQPLNSSPSNITSPTCCRAWQKMSLSPPCLAPPGRDRLRPRRHRLGRRVLPGDGNVLPSAWPTCANSACQAATRR